MSKNNFTEIGYTRKVHGLKGGIKLAVQAEYVEDYAHTQVLFLDLGSSVLPFFIREKVMGSDLIVYFEEIDSRESAFDLIGKTLYLRDEDVLSEEERTLEMEQLEYAFLKDYSMQQLEGETIGIIQSVEDFPQQEMAFVLYNKQEIMIPLNQEFIKEIDKKTKTILVDLPEGLLDM